MSKFEVDLMDEQEFLFFSKPKHNGNLKWFFNGGSETVTLVDRSFREGGGDLRIILS